MATVPVPITWVAGQVVTAAQLNANVRDALNFLLGKPLAVLRQAAAQSMVSGTWNALNFDTEDIDRDGGHSTTTNTSRYTSQTAGWYDLFGTSNVAANATGARGCAVTVNGSVSNLYGRQYGSVAASADFTSMSAHAILFLNVGDYAELRALQSSGVSLNTQIIGLESPRLQAAWISN